MTVVRGSIVVADLDPVQGHEQAGRRPCVVMTDPALHTELRYPVLAVVPLTTKQLDPSSYPQVRPVRGSGLRALSTALYDQVRSIDPHRIKGMLGNVETADLKSIENALARFLGLG